MINVVFVCLGNICRSPMAEFLFKKYLEEKGVSNQFNVTSRGTASWEVGNPVYSGTRDVLDRFDIDYSQKRAEQITEDDYFNNDYIICMDRKNYNFLVNYKNGKYANKVFMLQEGRDVLDPWYTRDFETTYSDIVGSFDRWYDTIVSGRK